MLSMSGTANLGTRLLHAIAVGANSNPAPSSDPIIACVVDTGRRVNVAIATQPTVPQITARVNPGVGLAETMPLVKSFIIRSAKSPETSAPASVVAAPQNMAVR